MSRILDFLETIKLKLTNKEYDKLQNRIAYLESVEKDFKQLKFEQEKKDNLLELYRELLFITKFEKSISNDNYKECVNSIIALEIELKEEMK